MFYNKYSDYSPEEIKNKNYEKLCNLFLNIARHDRVKEKIQTILYEGGYGDFAVNTGLTKNNKSIERKKRIGYAYLLATNPETFDVLIQNNINLFHGTNSNALPNILKYGMQSVNELSSKNITPSTGEEWSRIGGKRNFISFTDDIDTALDYASVTSSKDKSNFQKSFGILIGMSSNSLKHVKTCNVHSDLPEVGIINNIPLEHIKFIGVPEDKVELVRKLIGNSEIIISPISIDEKFYYVDLDFGDISFDTEKANELANRTNPVTTTFNNNELSELSKTRKYSGIHSIYENFKQMIKSKGKENNNNAKDK